VCFPPVANIKESGRLGTLDAIYKNMRYFRVVDSPSVEMVCELVCKSQGWQIGHTYAPGSKRVENCLGERAEADSCGLLTFERGEFPAPVTLPSSELMAYAVGDGYVPREAN